MGKTCASDSMSRSSVPVPSEAFRYKPHFPFRTEPKTMRLPSGLQIGDELSCAASKVKREVAPRDSSVIQMSPPWPSCRWAAIRVTSSDKSRPR
jgi:hypothetical protein